MAQRSTLKLLELFVFSLFSLATVTAMVSQMYDLGNSKYRPVMADSDFKNNPEYEIVDTIGTDTVKLNNGDIVKLAMMEGPTKNDCYYTEAQQQLSQLIMGKKSRIEKVGTNNDGKPLAYIYADNITVNYYMVGEGYARLNHNPTDKLLRIDFVNAEKTAREGKKGIWGCE